MEVLCLLETGYNTFMTTSNRSIPMAIAIYRYCCVFYNNWLLDISNKKILERSILLYVAGKALGNTLGVCLFLLLFPVSVSPVVSTYLMLRHPYYLETKRYNICQGREEAYIYPDLDFYTEEFVGPLNRISMRDPTRYGD